MTATEEQGYSKQRLAAQLIGTLPPVTKICTVTGKPYQVYPRDKDHPRWKKEAKPKVKKTQSFDDLDLAA